MRLEVRLEAAGIFRVDGGLLHPLAGLLRRNVQNVGEALVIDNPSRSDRSCVPTPVEGYGMKKLTATVLAPVLALFLGGPAFAADTAAKPERIDINTASAEQIKDTLGVSDDDAQRIIEARPYARKDDLTEKKVLSADRFEKLKKLIDSIC
jgi:hypothetical protein